MRLCILAICLLWPTFALSQDNPFAPDPFGNSPKSKAEPKLEHPDGETPRERMNVLAHTSSLPDCDRIEIIALQLVKPFNDADPKKKNPKARKMNGAAILSTVSVKGKAAKEMCKLWRSLQFDVWASAFCHIPAYGLRFYRDDQLIFETTVCWACQNFMLPESGSKTATTTYGFRQDKQSDRLLEIAKKIAPNSSLAAFEKKMAEAKKKSKKD